MKFVKLNILSRSLDTIYEYNKDGRSFWTDFFELFKSTANDAVVESIGRLQCRLYFPLTEDKDIVTTVKETLKKLGLNPDEFVIFVSDLKPVDIEKLKNDFSTQIDGKKWIAEAEKFFASEQEAAAAKEGDKPTETEEKPTAKIPDAGDFITISKAGAAKPKEEAPAADNPFFEISKKFGGEKKDGHPQGEAAKPKETEKPSDLHTEATRINKLKEQLLGMVYGQRHAVDEVVQTIFECDAFNGVDEKHRGPLASFLFTGPSGVGKTFLATKCAELLGRNSLTVDMSEFAEPFSTNAFIEKVASFVYRNPDGIVIFDEIEKAHMMTIYLFLQILDAGRLSGGKSETVSFRKTIVFITTNAGSSLYSDPTVTDLSGISRRTILEALRTDVKPGYRDPAFPECLTTRFANGHVILFNHLEPFALMQIIRDEINKQISLFRKSYDVNVNYDADMLAALVLYSAGGTADARSLRGMAKNVVVKELQDIVMQTFHAEGINVNNLKNIEFVIDPTHGAPETQALFIGHEKTHVLVFADDSVAGTIRPLLTESKTEYEFLSDPDAMKRRVRGVVDYILIDPLAGKRPMEKMPNDIEDIEADGIDLFRYVKEYFTEIPVYFLNVRGREEAEFSTLLAKGGRGVITLKEDAPEAIKEQLDLLSFSALVNNNTFGLGRSGKILTYNCSQFSTDSENAVIVFDKLELKFAPASADSDVIMREDDKNNITFADVIGCSEAKKALGDFCRFVADPRKLIMQGKKIPKGVLLYGPPGTGKTLLAKAMATEAKAAFIPTTATTLFDSYVGQSEKNVRELFRRARKYAPAIIFIDEVDAFARKRTGGSTSVHYENVLNAFIAEMDGFVTDERRPVFILAATNFDVDGDGSRVLDPAFVRRFDRKIYVDLPKTEERFALLKMLLTRHGVNFGEKHDEILQNLADRSSGLSNADLTAVVDMFIRACEDKTPTGAGLMDALDAFRFGETNEYDETSLKQTACHESGHALVSAVLGEMPAFLTIVSRGNYGGFMERSRNEKKLTNTFGDLMRRVCVSLAGRIAEIEVYGQDEGLNTGASSDLEHARYFVKVAYNDYAMGDKLFTEGTDEDCEKMMREQYDRTCALIKENRDTLLKLSALLYEKKSLNQVELKEFFAEYGIK